MRRSLSDPYTITGLIILIVAISIGQQTPDLFEQKDTGTDISHIFAEARWILDSQQKYNEVRVPFTQERSLINVQVLWAGKPVKCVLDTGASYVYVSGPQTLDLAAIPTGIPVQLLSIGENRAYGEWFLVPSLELGSFKLRNIPAILSSTVRKANGQKISLAQAKGFEGIILGNYIFQNTVLTIDYQKQEIILRDRDYDVARIPHPHSHLLDLWEDENLVLQGQLAGHPARFLIDSGNAGGMAINSAFAQKYLSTYPRVKSTTKLAYGVIASEKMPDVNGNIGGIEFNTGTLTILPLESNVDVLVGESFLKHFRITIDYSRRKILLEPYSQS